MKSSRPLALVLLLVALCAVSVRADIALDGPWYAGSAVATVGTPSFSPNNTSASFTFGSGANDQSGTSSLRALLWTYFDDVTLTNDGDWVRVSFTAQWPTNALNSANALRFGLFDHNAKTRSTNLENSNSDAAFDQSVGYFTTMNLGGATNPGSIARVRTGGDVNALSIIAGSQQEVVGSNTAALNALAANTPYNFSLQITRNSASEAGLVLVAASGGVSATTDKITATKFNTFYLLNSQQTGLHSIDFSNFEVTFSVAPPPDPVTMTIAASEGAPGSYDLSWNSRPGKMYDLLSSSDLAAPIAEWPVHHDGNKLHEAIPATGSITTLMAIPSANPRRFFALREYDAPPLLEVDFEADPGGFTAETDAGTVWEWGIPASSGPGGTVDRGNGATEAGTGKCWGTGIGNPGFFSDPTTNSRLISPVIDLTDVPAAALNFSHAIDLPEEDSAVVRIINADTGVEIVAAPFPLAVTDAAPTSAAWQSSGPLALPVGARIRIVWSLTGSGGNANDYLGWYIDDVVVASQP